MGASDSISIDWKTKGIVTSPPEPPLVMGEQTVVIYGLSDQKISEK